MEALSFNQKLDLILKVLVEENGGGKIQREVFEQQMYHHMKNIELRDMIEHLVLRECVLIDKYPNPHQPWYTPTSLGKEMVRTGNGFEVKEKREQQIYQNSMQSTVVAKKSHRLGVWVLIVSIASLIVSVLAFLVAKHWM